MDIHTVLIVPSTDAPDLPVFQEAVSVCARKVDLWQSLAFGANLLGLKYRQDAILFQ
jgi:hypothetical protein